MTLPLSTRGCGTARALLAAGVLLALCFSVGEGVQLIPFPDLGRGAASPEAESASARQPDSGPLLRYSSGRLDMPVKVQKRSKRQPDACGPAAGQGPVCYAPQSRPSPPLRVADHHSYSPAALSPGRAPPRAS